MIPKTSGTKGVMNTSTNAAIASRKVMGIKYLAYLTNKGLMETFLLNKYLLIRASEMAVPKEADIIMAGSSKIPWGKISSRLVVRGYGEWVRKAPKIYPLM